MARHGDTRSPSPVGSSYSSSKRNRRDDDRYERSRREDGRNHRRRSRTRSPDVGSILHHLGKMHANGKSRDGIAIVMLDHIAIARGKGEKKMYIVRLEGIGPGTDVDHEIVTPGETTGDGAARGI